MKDSYDALGSEKKEELNLEKTLKEMVPTGYNLLTRFKKGWYDPQAMSNYVKLNPEFKNIRGLIEEDLASILTDVKNIENLYKDGEYEACEKVLKQIQNKYDKIIEIISEKEEKFNDDERYKINIPDKIKLKNLKDGFTLTKVIKEYENKLKETKPVKSDEFIERFDKLINFAENYIEASEAGKRLKYSPDEIVEYIQQKLDEYSSMKDTERYTRVSELKDKVVDLPIPVEEVSENKTKKKKVKKKSSKN